MTARRGTRVVALLCGFALAVVACSGSNSASSPTSVSNTTSAPQSTAVQSTQSAVGESMNVGFSFVALRLQFSAQDFQCVGEAISSALGATRTADLRLTDTAQRKPLTAVDAQKAAPPVAKCPGIRTSLARVLLTDPTIGAARAACVVAAISDTSLVALVEKLLVASTADTAAITAASTPSTVASSCTTATSSPVTVSSAAAASALATTLARRIGSCSNPTDEAPVNGTPVLAVTRCGTSLRIEVYPNNNSRDSAVALRKTICASATRRPTADVSVVTDLIAVSGDEAAVRQAATDLGLTAVVLCEARP